MEKGNDGAGGVEEGGKAREMWSVDWPHDREWLYSEADAKDFAKGIPNAKIIRWVESPAGHPAPGPRSSAIDLREYLKSEFWEALADVGTGDLNQHAYHAADDVIARLHAQFSHLFSPAPGPRPMAWTKEGRYRTALENIRKKCFDDSEWGRYIDRVLSCEPIGEATSAPSLDLAAGFDAWWEKMRPDCDYSEEIKTYARGAWVASVRRLRSEGSGRG